VLPVADRRGLAAGYRDAMHGLCLECHRQQVAESAAEAPFLDRCDCCHRAVIDREVDDAMSAMTAMAAPVSSASEARP
jgi:hypothetical protein